MIEIEMFLSRQDMSRGTMPAPAAVFTINDQPKAVTPQTAAATAEKKAVVSAANIKKSDIP